ncbi:MAG: hypothetical protein HUU20_15460 [Pirellulales bacterium]|nr:hypothetical protein [Pirellulales bacterium]
MKRLLGLAVMGCLAAIPLHWERARAADASTSPAVAMFDTGESAGQPLPLDKPDSTSGWILVPEDQTAHPFVGDAVVRNDRLTLVLRKRGGLAEVYSHTDGGLKQRAVLSPIHAAARGTAELAGLQILENSPAAAVLSASVRTAGGNMCRLNYRLTVGQAIVEIQPGAGTDRLLVLAESRYALVPDFLGDDMVFSAEATARPRLRLPTENLLLGFLDRGSAQLMCVWQSGRQGAVAVRSAPDRPAAFRGFEIEAAQGKSLWIAILEDPHLWHEQTVSAENAQAEMTLAWKPPFPAKWRADLVNADGPGRSWYFRSANDPGETPSPAVDAGAPCCLDADRAVVRLRQGGFVSAGWSFPCPMLVYAIDRSQATPLTTWCPIDVLRNTLGVGPCQYILQTEGLASDSNPTPDNVMTWVEKQFQRKKQKKARDEIRDMLDQMVGHVRHAQARIGVYAGLAGQVRAICQEAGQDQQAVAGKLAGTADRLEQVAAGAQPQDLPERAGRLATEIASLIDRDNSLADCQRIGREIRAIGAAQDRALSNSRMTVRWLRQSAAMIAEDDASAAELARKVQVRSEKILQLQ